MQAKQKEAHGYMLCLGQLQFGQPVKQELETFASAITELYQVLNGLVQANREGEADYAEVFEVVDQWLEWYKVRAEVAKSMQLAASKMAKKAKAS